MRLRSRLSPCLRFFERPRWNAAGSPDTSMYGERRMGRTNTPAPARWAATRRATTSGSATSTAARSITRGRAASSRSASSAAASGSAVTGRYSADSWLVVDRTPKGPPSTGRTATSSPPRSTVTSRTASVRPNASAHACNHPGRTKGGAPVASASRSQRSTSAGESVCRIPPRTTVGTFPSRLDDQREATGAGG